MLVKFFIFLFWIHNVPVTEGCGEVYFSNDSYSFNISQIYNITLGVRNVSSPFTLILRASWDRVDFIQNNFSITGEDELTVPVLAEMQYIYDIDALCLQKYQQNEQVLATTRFIVAKSDADSKLQMRFGIAISIALCIAMFFLGTDLEFEIILSYLKRPIGPVIGICSQFIGMPIASYVIGYLLLRDQPFERFGLLLIGCSPGGTSSNFWTAFFKGDLNLSVTMTFCSSVASFGLSTLWIWALGSHILTNEDDIASKIPYLRIFIAILSLVLPIALGMFFKYKKPEIAEKLRRFTRPIFFIFILVSVCFGIYINRAFFSLVGVNHALCAVLLSATGFIVGALSAFFGRLQKDQIIAVSIETAIQNPSAAFVVMQTTIPSPYSDMGSVPVISYMAFATGPPMLSVLLIYKLVEFIRSRQKAKKEGDPSLEPTTDSNGIKLANPTKNKQTYGSSDNKGFQS